MREYSSGGSQAVIQRLRDFIAVRDARIAELEAELVRVSSIAPLEQPSLSLPHPPSSPPRAGVKRPRNS